MAKKRSVKGTSKSKHKNEPQRKTKMQSATTGSKKRSHKKFSYPSLAEQKQAWEKRSVLPHAAAGNVLGFKIIGFLLERPAGGGVGFAESPVSLPDGTKQFYLWLMHVEYRFMDKTTRQPVERPLWIQFTDIYSYQKDGEWYVQVRGGWADKDDVTHWEGFVGVIGIAVG